MNPLPFLIGLAELVVVMGAFAILAYMGWPGEPALCLEEGNCYCERVHLDRTIRQPANTWSNVAAIIVGLAVLWVVGVAPSADTPSNPMTSPTLYSVLYGVCVIFLGPGSMFFHASVTKWGGLIDNISMNLFITFVFFYDFARVLKLSAGIFLLLYLLVNVMLAAVIRICDDLGTVVFGVGVGLACLLEALILNGDGGCHRKPGFLVLALVLFGLAFVIWLLSKKPGRPLCWPDSWFQGHAIWHILAAASAGAIYLYLRTEMGA